MPRAVVLSESSGESSSDGEEDVSPPKIRKPNIAVRSNARSDGQKIIAERTKNKSAVAARRKGALSKLTGDNDDDEEETMSSSKVSVNSKKGLNQRRKGALSKLTGEDDEDVRCVDARNEEPSKNSQRKPTEATKIDDDESNDTQNKLTTADSIDQNDVDDVKPEIKPETGPRLTDAQRATIERNRQKALLLKQARLAKMPTVPTDCDGEGGFSGGKKNEKMTKVIDSGGGFLIEEETGGEDEEQPTETVTKQPGAILQDHLPDSDPSKLTCEGCQKPFAESYLFSHFDCPVCDECRDHEETHRLITKTDAKNEYLLKDEDFDKREPPLKYILKKNPHNSRWGDMKLFLHYQVRARALEIYGSEEALEKRHDDRDEARQKMRQKKFDKKVADLRKKVRSSLYTKNLGGHQHEFEEEEEYDSDKDEYSKKCKTCDHVITYEKM